jgi:hypothetical protein
MRRTDRAGEETSPSHLLREMVPFRLGRSLNINHTRLRSPWNNAECPLKSVKEQTPW